MQMHLTSGSGVLIVVGTVLLTLSIAVFKASNEAAAYNACHPSSAYRATTWDAFFAELRLDNCE